MTPTGERGRMDEDEIKVVVEEDTGGRKEKGRAGPPLLPASQPALSPKLHHLLNRADNSSAGTERRR